MPEIVLFVCEDNSILSPMAEVFLRRYCKSIYQVCSAGIEPRPTHIYTLQVMEEIGIDLLDAPEKSILDLRQVQRVDYLITLSDMVNKRYVFKKENIGSHLHWPFKNPLAWADHFAEINPFNKSQIPAQQKPSSIPKNWLSPENNLVETHQNIDLSSPGTSHRDAAEIRKRFRRTRDEIEVQVMNWLEEMGIGPFWWGARGKAD